MKDHPKITARCPIRTTLEMLGGKWRLLIIEVIGDRSLRFSEILRAVPEISEKMLAQELSNLADNSLVIRHDGQVSPNIVYSLTEQGQKARILIQPIRAFGLYYVETQS